MWECIYENKGSSCSFNQVPHKDARKRFKRETMEVSCISLGHRIVQFLMGPYCFSPSLKGVRILE